MGVVLLLADSGDSWALHVEQALLRRHQPVRRVDAETIVESLAVNWRLGGSGHSAVCATAQSFIQDASCIELLGVFVRTHVAGLELPDGFVASEDREYVQMEWAAAFSGWLNSLSCPVINAPVLGRPANLLPSHASLRVALAQAGFVPAPHVLVSHTDRAIHWFDRWNRQARLQSMGVGQRVRCLQGAEALEVIAAVLQEGPATLQSVPEGARMKAFVAGQAVVGGIWRTAVQDRCLRECVLDATMLPPRLAQPCRRLAYSLGLTFAEMDLVVGRDEAVFCLGVSGSPEFAPCSDALREVLVRHLVAVLDHTQEWPPRDSDVWPHRRSADRQLERAACRSID